VFLATYLGFALTRNVALIGALFVLYGLYQGMFRAIGKAFRGICAPVAWGGTAPLSGSCS
jgi:hypothetical protein